MNRVACAFLGLMLAGAACCAADISVPPAGTVRVEETNLQELLRSSLQVQEQLHSTQLTIERNRQESEAAAARSAEALGNRLQGLEQALASQRTQQWEALQSANRMMVVVGGSLAALGFLALLFTAYFQWRTVSRLAEISAALPLTHALGPGMHVAALGAGDTHRLVLGAPEESNQRLLGAIERLEKRIHDLEHTAPAASKEGTSPAQVIAVPPEQSKPEAASAANGAGAPEAARITMLLGKGQSLLNLDHSEEALACFDEVLALEPSHAEALVKKGTALERLRKLDEAISCYDRAIAANNSMTIAYLYKGGLFNRMERFSEALECYEKALRTQETRHG